MTTESLSTTYENGKRIIMQRTVMEKSDDLFKLANLHRELEVLKSRYNTALANGGNAVAISSEIDRITAEIKEQQSIVDGYDKPVTVSKEVNSAEIMKIITPDKEDTSK